MNSYQFFCRVSEIVDAALEIRRNLDQTALTFEMKIKLDHIISLGLDLEWQYIDEQNKTLDALVRSLDGPVS